MGLIVLLGGVASSQAQMGGHGQRQGQQQKAPPPGTPLPKAAPDSVPGLRLESGAILCKSRDDLVGYQAKMGGDAGPSARTPDCRILRRAMPIEVLDQDGPSRSQVVSTDAAKETGWTNSYLPSARAPGAGGANTAK
jgi:hypothetical protein